MAGEVIGMKAGFERGVVLQLWFGLGGNVFCWPCHAAGLV